MKPDAMSMAFWASAADATDPVRMIEIGDSANMNIVARDRGVEKFDSSPTSRPTETSTVAIFRPSRARAKMDVCPFAIAET